MFHIANRIYLEYDYRFHQQYPYTVASDRWDKHPITISKSPLTYQVSSFDQLIQDHYDDNIENFWTDMLSKDNKFLVFVDPPTMAKLQFQYWKSIFGDSITLDDLHLLYTSHIESVRVRSYFDLVGQWDAGSDAWTKSNDFTELRLPTYEESKILFDSTKPSTTLRNLDKSTLSFEYLLADYLYNPNTIYKTHLIDKIKNFTWNNWMDELAQLKYEILSGTLDISAIDPTLNLSVGNIEEQLSKSEFLKWVVDPAFQASNIDYIRKTYDYKIFEPCWNKTYELWGSQEKVHEINELINNERYEDLLNRDIDRGYACSYTRQTFFMKCNQVFATYCYQKKRSGNTNDLAPFSLHR